LKEDKMFYTYLWLREDGTPYYVGKGTGNRAFISSKHGVHKPSEKERILIEMSLSEEEAFETEKFLISYFGRLDVGTGCLRNLTEGGENPPRTKKGRPISPEHREKISNTLKFKGIVPPSRKGIPHTQAMREQISNTMKVLRSKNGRTQY
jgi:hypothetical protein